MTLRKESEAIPTGPLTEQDSKRLDQMVADVEEYAQKRASLRSRHAKQARAAVKELFKADPSLGAVARNHFDQLLRLDDEVIEELLEMALWMRSFRAERQPYDGKSLTFSDPDALAKHLASVLRK